MKVERVEQWGFGIEMRRGKERENEREKERCKVKNATSLKVDEFEIVERKEEGW